MRTLLLYTALAAVTPVVLHGATLRVVGSADVQLNAPQTLSVILISEKNINAFEGTIRIDPSSASIQRVRDANSLVSFWIERPDASDDGVIRFSGIVPGGESGSLPLFVVDIQAISFGADSITGDASVFVHDGKGTQEQVAVTYVVSESATPPSSEEDTTPPDSIMLLVERNKNLFDGDATLIFSAQDDGSGIAYYEVQEHGTKTPAPEGWRGAESPYRLLNQGRSGYVSVKAVDYAGNVRIETIPLTNSLVANILLVLVLLVLVYALWYALKKRFTVV